MEMLLDKKPRAQPLCSEKGKFGHDGDCHVPAQQKVPCILPSPRAERWGSLRQSPSISPALTAFNMLMTLSRAGAALCKTHVQPSVMDICSETQC